MVTRIIRPEDANINSILLVENAMIFNVNSYFDFIDNIKKDVDYDTLEEALRINNYDEETLPTKVDVRANGTFLVSLPRWLERTDYFAELLDDCVDIITDKTPLPPKSDVAPIALEDVQITLRRMSGIPIKAFNLQ